MHPFGPKLLSDHERPIFIVGAPRSGTTLLQYMLRSHPRISLPTGESHFFIPLYRNSGSYGDLSKLENLRQVLKAMHHQNAEFLDTDLHGLKFDIERLAIELHSEERSSMQSIIAGLYEKNAVLEGKARWGDKTPYYVLHIPKLLEWFPGAQIIHLIRDGRDVALSLFGRKHDFGVYNIYIAAKYWQQYVETGHKYGSHLSSATYLEIHYEDILLKQKDTMQNICQFLGEEFSVELLNFKKARGAGKTPLLQMPVQSGNAEKWRKYLSKWQIRIFENAAGNTLEQFGYPLMNNPSSLPLLVRAGYRAHNQAVRQWQKIHQGKGTSN